MGDGCVRSVLVKYTQWRATDGGEKGGLALCS